MCTARNYKNGYVWNDLSENDVIYPSDGVEYVLKGSEIFPGCTSGNHHHLLFRYSPSCMHFMTILLCLTPIQASSVDHAETVHGSFLALHAYTLQGSFMDNAK